MPEDFKAFVAWYTLNAHLIISYPTRNGPDGGKITPVARDLETPSRQSIII
jgi:hypothetical protein